MSVVCTLGQLREAVRVADALQARMLEDDGTDSPQIHLTDEWDVHGWLRIDLWSCESGQPVESWIVDTGQAPGETGTAVQR